MVLTDYHVHTNFSDGRNTPEEMVLAAIKMGLKEIGFSDHSYTEFDTRYCVQKENIEKYKAEILALKEKYKDKIKILLGVEQDYYASVKAEGYDFIIGSVHYVKSEGEYITVDEGAKVLVAAANKYFDGDIYDLVEKYYKMVGKLVKKTGATIIGHFDLIAKFNEKYNLFDEEDERYVKAYKRAVNKLIKKNVAFEINTGGMARGYMSTPYPSKAIREYIKSKGGKFVLCSDAHETKNLCYAFNETEE